MPYTVLICDDNETVQDCLSDYLISDGFRVVHAFDGECALAELARNHVDIVVLDVMLPGMSGLEVCRKIRKTSDIPIIMLSAKSTTEDKIFGIELGADDYIVKPFSAWEMTVRIKRILKRANAVNEPARITFNDLTLFPEDNTADVHGKEVHLTVKETKVLFCLQTNAGKACSREKLLNAAWGYEFYGDMRVVDSLIKRLRQKLMAEPVSFRIAPVYGLGYKLEEAT